MIFIFMIQQLDKHEEEWISKKQRNNATVDFDFDGLSLVENRGIEKR